jgi:DMSO/TMAO reductase YedYZ heme-binding membrane subunit
MLSYLGLILALVVYAIIYKYGKFIHKHEYKFYLGFLSFSLLLTLLILLNVNVMNLFGIYEVFYAGHLSFALFTIVMLAGALNKKSPYKIAIIKVRRELAILGFITLLPHAFLRLDSALNGFNFTGLIAFIFIIPLVITSFPVVRKKMQPKTWNKVHYLAYIVYTMIYIHLIFDIFITSSFSNIQIKDSGYVYLLFFILYVIFTIRQKLLKLKPKSA